LGEPRIIVVTVTATGGIEERDNLVTAMTALLDIAKRGYTVDVKTLDE
jgi:hypothetical protein